MKRIVVRIERVVLRGPLSQPARIVEGLQGELARLLGDADVARALAATGNVPHLRPGPLHAGHSTAPLQLGELAARAIAQSLHGRPDVPATPATTVAPRGGPRR